MTTKNVRAQQTETDEIDDLRARLTTAETAVENAVVLLAREMYVSDDAEHQDDDRSEWDEDVLLAATYDSFILRARAALACPPQERGE